LKGLANDNGDLVGHKCQAAFPLLGNLSVCVEQWLPGCSWL